MIMSKFLSDGWIEHTKNYMYKNLHPERDLKNVTTSLLGVIEHVPPNDITMNFFLNLDNGKLTEFVVSTGDSHEKEAAFVITGNYGTFRSILKGDMNMTIALLKNRLKLKGSKVKALRLMKPLDGVIVALREVTDEFEE
jgi:putative sterol carrier protein